MAMTLRPLQADDSPEAYSVMVAAFADLGERAGLPSVPHAPPAAGQRRIDHFLATDPGGAWVAVASDGRLAGCALAMMRDGLWGLSLLVVRPDAQSGGVGRRLLQHAWSYGEADRRGAIILASPDHRALRAYARLGLTLHPTVSAVGRASGVTAPPQVRPGDRDDWELAASIDRKVRGADRAPDMEALTSPPNEFLVLPGGGYTVVRDGDVRLLAAVDDDAAALLLRAAMAAAGDREVTVEWITSAQNWAVASCLDAGLDLRTNVGAVFLGGDVGPFNPYLPNGAYL